MRPLDTDELSVLSTVLRVRPSTVLELEAQGALTGARLRTALAGLQSQGFVRLDGAELEVLEPASVVVAAASRALSDQAEGIAVLQTALAQLPTLTRDWRLGSGSVPGMAPVEAVHGTTNQWELWMRLMGQVPPRAPLAVFPDFGGLARVVIDNVDALRSAREQLGFSVRTITVASALSNPAEREQLEMFAAVGLEVRTLPSVPGWFYADDGVLAALPLEWGQAVPTSIALVREPSLVAPIAAYAERLWGRSTPIPGPGGNDPVLELLAQGLSDGAIAAASGMSLRTVRRRIADAAEHHGAASRFALGVEWERRRQTGRPS